MHLQVSTCVQVYDASWESVFNFQPLFNLRMFTKCMSASLDDVDFDDLTGAFKQFLLNRYLEDIEHILEARDESTHYGLTGCLLFL